MKIGHGWGGIDDESLALPPGDAPIAASFTRDGALLAIARDGATPEVVVAHVEPGLVALAYAAPLSSSDACGPGIDDVEFGRFDAGSSSWHAIDLACDRLFTGGATQDTSATLVFGTSGAPVIAAASRLQVDGWTQTAWVSDDALHSVRLTDGSVQNVGGISAETSAIALAHAGTLLWVGTESTAGTTIFEVEPSSNAGTPFHVAPGMHLHDLVYLDRPPVISASPTVEAYDCETPNVSFPIFGGDQDGDPVSITIAGVPEDASFDGQTLTGTFPLEGAPHAVGIYGVSGHFLSTTTVIVGVDPCPTPTPTPTATPTPTPPVDEEPCYFCCECNCRIGLHASPSAGIAPCALLALAALALIRRRRA